MNVRPLDLIIPCLTIALATGCAPDAVAPDERPGASAPLASRADNFGEWTIPVNLGPAVNSPHNDQQAALSKDGLSLYFNSNRPTSPEDVVADANLWVARRECRDCAWTAAVPLPEPINSPVNDANPGLSRDGHWLFLTSGRPGTLGGNDLWVSYRQHVHDDFGWTTPVNLGPGVNTSAQETAASHLEHEDLPGAELYFNRQTGMVTVPQGDLYVSVMGADGVWGIAQPVTALNSTAADQRASIHPNGLDIYFWSDRSGAAHIWQSERATVLDPWSPPTMVGGAIADAPTNMPLITSHGAEETLFMVRSVPGANGVAHLDMFASTRRRAGTDR